ncbi:MAG: tripartite tricarboxylate transporter substrate binding protein [Betaproteobacteria bacterium]
MKLSRISLKILWIVLITLTSLTYAQNKNSFPNKAIKIVVPFAPGGGADTLIRILSPGLSEIWKQSILIENKPGASGSIGADFVANSIPDGYTLMMGTTASVTEKNVKSFIPVALVSASPYIVTINPSLGIKSITDLISYAKKYPEKIRYGSSGLGSASHLSGELFASIARINMLHVPYKGTGQALTDLLGGQIDVMFAPAQTVMPQIEAGKLIALGQTGLKRSESLPNLPTVSESGLSQYSSVGWFGILAPLNTPKTVILAINQDVNKLLSDPKVKKEMMDRGSDPATGSTEDYAVFLNQDIAKWSKLIKDNHIEFQ